MAIYKIDDWAKKRAIYQKCGLLEGSLNDDIIGKTLDALADAGIEEIETKICLKAIKNYKIPINVISYITTLLLHMEEL